VAEIANKKAGAKPRKRAGLYTVLGGIAALIAGYICLGLGSITVAPALIIGAFAVMAIGIALGWD
jgi:hypothetical protein